MHIMAVSRNLLNLSCKNLRQFTSVSSSLITKEVQKFSDIGKEWWNFNSIEGAGPLHSMNPCRVGFIRSERSHAISTENLQGMVQLRRQRVLDVGCGGGLLAESLSRLGAEVTAIDPSVENIFVASSHSVSDPATSSIDYRQCTVEDIVEQGLTFDIVTSLEVVEHVERPEQFLANCARCVAPGGSLFVSTMNKTYKAYLLAVFAAEKILRVVPDGTHDWRRFLTPQEVHSVLRRSGLTVRRSTGIVPAFSPWTGGVLSSWRLADDDLDVNYIVHAMRPL